MLRQGIGNAFRHNGLLFQIIVGCGIGLLLSISTIWIPPLLILGTLVAALFIFVILRRPEIGLLLILIATSSIVFENQLPLLSIGIGSLHISDVLLISLLGSIAIRWLVEPGFKFVQTPLDWPLLIFLGMTMLSTFIAIYHSSVEIEEVRGWIRILFYYLTFFIVTNLVKKGRQLDILLNNIFLLATIIASAMIVQFALGDSIQLLPGRVETLNTQGTIYEDVTRIAPPGFSIVLVSFMSTLCVLVLEKFKPHSWLKFFQCSLLGMAILVTFLRSYWAALVMVFVLMIILFRGINRQRFIALGLLVVFLVTIILFVVFSNPSSQATRLVGASADRFDTLLNSGTFQGQDSSLNWRLIENGYAFSAIVAHPLIGMGMGTRYRPWDARLDTQVAGVIVADFRNLIHNGHLRILLQSGLLGYFAFIWLSLVFLIRGFRYWRTITDNRMKGIVLGCTLVYLVVLIAAVTNSTFTQWNWTPVIGIIMGINEIIFRWHFQIHTTEYQH